MRTTPPTAIGVGIHRRIGEFTGIGSYSPPGPALKYFHDRSAEAVVQEEEGAYGDDVYARRSTGDRERELKMFHRAALLACDD